MFSRHTHNFLFASFCFLFFSFSAICKKKEDISDHRIVRLNLPTKKIETLISIYKKPAVKIDNYYYWYDNFSIHQTQGAYSGYILDGPYEEFLFPGNNLLIKGNIKNGLKSGYWVSFYENGNIQETSYWNKGKLERQKAYYDTNAILVKTENYYRNRLNGKIIEYKADTIWKVIVYKNGKKIESTHDKRSQRSPKIFFKKKKSSNASLAPIMKAKSSTNINKASLVPPGMKNDTSKHKRNIWLNVRSFFNIRK